VQLGLIAFSNSASVLVPPTSDRSTMLAAIGTLQAGGGTATADAIYLGLNAISTIPPGVDGKKAPAAIVLMSDGAPTIGHGTQSPLDSVTSASAAAKAAGVKINTIAYGTEEGTVNVQGQDVPVPADPNTMAQIASQTGGQSFTASTAQQLKSVYNQIGRLVGYDVHHQEITAWFTGLALLLAMAAAVSALIWSQRIT
jgi:Ca-activated chloride channel family protein